MKQFVILMLFVICSTAMYAQKSGQSKSKKEDAKTTKVYQCPTHPEVVSTKPGICAKCGEKLEVQRQGSKQLASVTYSCPMHPQVVNNEAGKCPKCGMELKQKQHKKGDM